MLASFLNEKLIGFQHFSSDTHQESTASCCQSVCGGSPDVQAN